MNSAGVALILLLLACVLFSCACVEVGTSTRSTTILAGRIEVTEHTYFWGNDGPFTKTYDVRVTIAGVEVARATGVPRERMEEIAKQFGS